MDNRHIGAWLSRHHPAPIHGQSASGHPCEIGPGGVEGDAGGRHFDWANLQYVRHLYRAPGGDGSQELQEISLIFAPADEEVRLLLAGPDDREAVRSLPCEHLLVSRQGHRRVRPVPAGRGPDAASAEDGYETIDPAGNESPGAWLRRHHPGPVDIRIKAVVRILWSVAALTACVLPILIARQAGHPAPLAVVPIAAILLWPKLRPARAGELRRLDVEGVERGDRRRIAWSECTALHLGYSEYLENRSYLDWATLAFSEEKVTIPIERLPAPLVDLIIRMPVVQFATGTNWHHRARNAPSEPTWTEPREEEAAEAWSRRQPGPVTAQAVDRAAAIGDWLGSKYPDPIEADLSAARVRWRLWFMPLAVMVAIGLAVAGAPGAGLASFLWLMVAGPVFLLRAIFDPIGNSLQRLTVSGVRRGDGREFPWGELKLVVRIYGRLKYDRDERLLGIKLEFEGGTADVPLTEEWAELILGLPAPNEKRDLRGAVLPPDPDY